MIPRFPVEIFVSPTLEECVCWEGRGGLGARPPCYHPRLRFPLPAIPWKSITSAVLSKTSPSALPRSGGFFEYDTKSERLTEVSRELEDPAIWNTPEKAQELGRERARLEQVVGTIDKVTGGLDEAGELLAMAVEEDDATTVAEVERDVQALDQHVKKL